MTVRLRGGAAVVFGALALAGCAPSSTTAPPRPPSSPRRVPERAIPPALAGPAGEGVQLTPCEPASPALVEAEKAFAGVNALATAAHDPSTLRSAKDALGLLVKSRCLAMSIEEAREVDTESVLAFRTWWNDGGRAWVGSYLALLPGPSQVVLPPDVRRSLAPEDHAHDAQPDPLVALMCPALDVACGAEARAWRLRATLFFERGIAKDDESGSPDPCAAQAARRDYPSWRRCIEEHRVTVPAPPLGELRAPRSGWLFLDSPSRGGTCLAKRAYHLESDAAYVTETCRPSVRDGAANPGDVVTSRKGRVSADNVREALWMILLADRVEDVQVSSQTIPIPEGMKPSWPASSGGYGSSSPHRVSATSDSADVAWRWQDGEKTIASGKLVVSSREPGRAYATALLEVAEAGFVEGPAAAPAPRSWR